MFNVAENDKNILDAALEVRDQTHTLELSRHRILFIKNDGAPLFSLEQGKLSEDGIREFCELLIGKLFTVCTGIRPGQRAFGRIVSMDVARETSMIRHTTYGNGFIDAHPEFMNTQKHRVCVVRIAVPSDEECAEYKTLYVTN